MAVSVVRSLASVGVTASLVGCMPTDVPRTAYVARPAHGRVAFNVAGVMRETTLRYTSSEKSGSVTQNRIEAAAPVEGAVGMVPGCEVGASIDLLAAFAEVRCQPVGYGEIGSVAVAISAKGGTAADALAKGSAVPYVASGVDATFFMGRFGLLTGAYVRYATQPDGPDHEGAVPREPERPRDGPFACLLGCPPPPSPAIESTRQEVRLSFPIGMTTLQRSSPNETAASRVMIGVVPSVIVHTRNQELTCEGCAPDVRLTGLDEEYSLALVWRQELEWR